MEIQMKFETSFVQINTELEDFNLEMRKRTEFGCAIRIFADFIKALYFKDIFSTFAFFLFKFGYFRKIKIKLEYLIELTKR